MQNPESLSLLAAAVWSLVWFGLGAIVIGIWMRRRWQSDVRELKAEQATAWYRERRSAQQSFAQQITLAQAEVRHWHRLYVAAVAVVDARPRKPAP